jgi:endonuclease-3
MSWKENHFGDMSVVDYATVLTRLAKQYPNPGALEFQNPYRTLVAVVLSARTRDEQVLKMLPTFFYAFPTPRALAQATEEEIYAKLGGIGMNKQKAAHLSRLAQRVMETFSGEIPRTLEELVTLAGVGRKTASVVLSSEFGVPAIAVDTHVHRITNRLGWVHTKTPAQTESQLLACVPKQKHRLVNRVFVPFGRAICVPGKPRCYACPIKDQCQYKEKNVQAPRNAEALLAKACARQEEIESLRLSIVNL